MLNEIFDFGTGINLPPVRLVALDPIGERTSLLFTANRLESFLGRDPEFNMANQATGLSR